MTALRLAILCSGTLALAACASAPDAAYPSLAIRDAEYASGQVPRPAGACLGEDGAPPVQGQFAPAPPAPPPPPPPTLSPDLVERVAQLEAQARAAHGVYYAGATLAVEPREAREQVMPQPPK